MPAGACSTHRIHLHGMLPPPLPARPQPQPHRCAAHGMRPAIAPQAVPSRRHGGQLDGGQGEPAGTAQLKPFYATCMGCREAITSGGGHGWLKYVGVVACCLCGAAADGQRPLPPCTHAQEYIRQRGGRQCMVSWHELQVGGGRPGCRGLNRRGKGRTALGGKHGRCPSERLRSMRSPHP